MAAAVEQVVVDELGLMGADPTLGDRVDVVRSPPWMEITTLRTTRRFWVRLGCGWEIVVEGSAGLEISARRLPGPADATDTDDSVCLAHVAIYTARDFP
jgi:hypothetical protein